MRIKSTDLKLKVIKSLKLDPEIAKDCVLQMHNTLGDDEPKVFYKLIHRALDGHLFRYWVLSENYKMTPIGMELKFKNNGAEKNSQYVLIGDNFRKENKISTIH